MAMFKDSEVLLTSDDPVFETRYLPGEVVLHPGIYQCTGCQREVPVMAHTRLPRRSHHQHTSAEGEAFWQLIVFADFRPVANVDLPSPFGAL